VSTALLIRPVERESDVEAVRQLFREYATTVDAPVCFQDFDKEVAGLPGNYAPPSGRLLLAQNQGAPSGCAAVRRLDDRACELKRLYIRPQFRGFGLGRLLTESAMQFAREAGYQVIRLDTLPNMQAAQRLYESLGFCDIPAYTATTAPGKRDMEARSG